MASSNSPEKFEIYKIGSVSPLVSIADPNKNAEYIIDALKSKELTDCSFIVFPELCITGYTCGDLFFQRSLHDETIKAIERIVKEVNSDNRLIAIGAPLESKGRLYNCAVLISQNRILGIVPKINIPNYQEFYEKRWFFSGEGIVNDFISICGKDIPFGQDLLFKFKGVTVGVEICEDLWVPIPPSSALCLGGAEIILNLSATDDNIGKFAYINNLIKSQSGRCRCVYAYASAGHGESSSDLVFSGINIIASDGEIIAKGERFSSNPVITTGAADIEKIRQERIKYSSFHQNNSNDPKYRLIKVSCMNEENLPSFDFDVNPTPFIPTGEEKINKNCEEIIKIQSEGLAQRLKFTGCKNIVVGISGGLDSTLALLVAHYAFSNLKLDLKGILGVTMPSVATSDRTFNNSVELMRQLGISYREIPVKDAVSQHFKDIGHDPAVFNSVYENSQARERTQILMDLANMHNGLVLGTGDMSELALGWCTYNGDHMSMYNVNGGVPKTLVKYLVNWFAETTPNEKLSAVLRDIVETPISPELIPSESKKGIGQKTEEIVGPYELHDFFLYHILRNGFRPEKIFYLGNKAFNKKYTSSEIKKWLLIFYKRFFSQQFKRSCLPDGPKIGSVCLSPRGDWRMPSDASANEWIKEIEKINIS